MFTVNVKSQFGISRVCVVLGVQGAAMHAPGTTRKSMPCSPTKRSTKSETLVCSRLTIERNMPRFELKEVVEDLDGDGAGVSTVDWNK